MTRMFVIGRTAAAVALMLAAGVHPVAAQAVDPQGCSDSKDLVAYLEGPGAVEADEGRKIGVDVLANARMLRNMTCGTPGDDSSPTPVPNEPPPTPVPAPTPVAARAEPTPGDDDSVTRRDACLLVTEAEVGTAMKQGVVANEEDPAGSPGQGCEFNGVTDAYTDVMYFQASGAVVYDEFHATAEANGVQAVPGLGDRAFSYVGGNGPGLVVVKGDKLFTLEFSGIGSGQSERDSLLILAQHAVGRVH
jgi:hypothetical protein